MHYLISAGGVKIEQTTLRDETLIFLQRLTAAVGNTNNTALVFSLQSSKRESLEYVNLLQTVDHLAARKDQRREPVEGNEILSVIQSRLLAKLPTDAEATPAANAFQETVTQMRRAYAQSNAERQQAEEDGLALRDRVRASYPFHPALIDLMRERWAAIPDFQRTRGALRFLAACLRASTGKGRAGPSWDRATCRSMIPRCGWLSSRRWASSPTSRRCWSTTSSAANARAKRIDDRRAKENPAEAIRRPAMRLATAILMYSFGGLRREGAGEGQPLPPGVTEAELLSVCVGPDLDSTTALACLKELKEQCLYLHFDGARYCFKKDPNVTLLIEQEAEQIGRNEKQVRTRVKEMIESRLAGHRNAIVWPESAADIPDRDPSFLFAYLPLEFSRQAAKPAGDDWQGTAREVRGQATHLPEWPRPGHPDGRSGRDPSPGRALPDRHRGRQDEGQATQPDRRAERPAPGAGIDRAGRRRVRTAQALHRGLAPASEEGGIGIEKIAAGGRPLQTTLNEKKQAMIHERIVELITSFQPRVFNTLVPDKIVELFRLGEGAPPTLGVGTGEVVDGFYSFLGFTRLMTSGVIRKAIARGVQEGHFGYVSGPKPGLSAEGKYEVAPNKVRFKVAVADDEIDLDSGFLMLPQAIPQPEVRVCPRCGKDPCECPSVCPRCGQTPCACPAACPKCGKAPCACPSVCPRCGKSPCVCVRARYRRRAQLLRRPQRPLHCLERHRKPRRHGR